MIKNIIRTNGFIFICVAIFILSCPKVNAYYDEQVLGAFVDAVSYAMLIRNAFSSELAKKYPNAKNSQNDCYNLVKDYMRYKNLTNSVNNTFRDSRIKMYCEQKYLSGILKDDSKAGKKSEYSGYHDTDDKSGFWIPKNINPIALTNYQLEQYRIQNITGNEYEYKDNILIKTKIQKVKELNRPLILKDINDAQKDIRVLENLKSALYEGDEVYVNRNYGLTAQQESELLRLKQEYGEGIFDETFNRRLKLYRQRQEYAQQKKSQEQFQNFSKNLINQFLSY